MDLLGGILGSMEKPPVINDPQRKKVKAQKELIEKQQEAEKKKLEKFRKEIQEKIHNFIKDGAQQKLQIEPMDKVFRSIVHDVSEVAGLASFSFGQEEEDRYVMLWKKEFAPSDEELLAYRKGEEWDPEKAKELAKQKELEDQEDKLGSSKAVDVPASNYRDKYKHLIGDEAALDAAKEMTSNTSYGFVPSTNKRDLRTIEQVMADTKARKKQKLHDGPCESSSQVSSSSPPPPEPSASATTTTSDGVSSSSPTSS